MHPPEALSRWKNVANGTQKTAQRVLRTFLAHTSPLKQFKLQTDRLAIIQLFDLLIAKYRTPSQQLQEGDPELMSNFISYFEGEKDPRNLMIIFSILHVPMTEWDVHANAQDLFEAVFNYFPITFKPPPDDPYGITAQDLKDRLRDCIAANSGFAPYAFPALLDKLDSTSMNTKVGTQDHDLDQPADYYRETCSRQYKRAWLVTTPRLSTCIPSRFGMR